MLREDLKKALKESMLAHEAEKTAALRLINATLKDKDIAARSKGTMDGISDDEILQMFQSMVKQRNESIEMYKKGGREDLAAKEQAEIEIIQSFMPVQMTEEEIKTVLQSAIEKMGATTMRDMGKVMGTLKGEYAGKMDFSKASKMLKDLLG
ncbi:MAG: GatB/YqeY domain-containing protein [Alphaproteobacteria bacterium]|nr:GatB/YqeY domain-containing protein [Alphaproteobacteria bacterium]